MLCLEHGPQLLGVNGYSTEISPPLAAQDISHAHLAKVAPVRASLLRRRRRGRGSLIDF